MVSSGNSSLQELPCDPQALLTKLIEHLQSLKQLYKKNSQSIHELPWFVLIGAKGVGKSRLMNQGTTIQETRDLPEDGKIYITPQALFIEMPGSWVSRDYMARYWVELIKQLRQIRPQQALDGIFLAVSATELAQPTELQPHIKRIHHILHFVSSSHQRPLPIHLMITQTDQIKGFQEFFNDLSAEQLALPWGFMLPLSSTAQPMLQSYQKGFSSLLARLQDRQLWCLQKTLDPEQIQKIIEFPLQMQTWQKNLEHWLKQVLTPSIVKNCPLAGFYLTSTLQQSHAVDMLTASYPQLPDLTHHHEPSVSEKSFFTKRLFNHTVIQKTSPHMVNTTLSAKRPFWQVLVFGLLVSFGFIYYSLELTQQVKNDLVILRQAQRHLLSITTTPQKSRGLSQDLTYFDKLLATQEAIKNIELPTLIQHLYPELRHLKNQTQKTYQQALDQLLAPLVQTSLETSIIQARTPLDKLTVLKTYLMLGGQHSVDTKFAQSVLQEIWSQHQSAQSFKNMIHLEFLINSKQPISINESLVHQTKEMLLTLNQDTLALLYLQLQYAHPLKTLNTQDGIHAIPELYQIEKFSHVFDTEIPTICQKLSQKSPALFGRTLVTDTHACTRQLQYDYTHAYKHWWQNYLIANLPKYPTTSHPQKKLAYIEKTFATFMSHWQHILKNTATLQQNSSSSSSWFNQQIAREFKTWQDENFHVKRLPQAVSQLKHHVLSITNHQSSDLQAFIATKLYYQDNIDALSELEELAQTLPKPLQFWLSNLLSELWSYQIELTQLHIEQHWQEDIFPFYQRKIAHRYPVDKASKEDISLAAFSDFFGPNGRLTHFIKQYVEPFYDRHLGRWYPKQRFSKHVSLPNTTMAQILRSDLIKDMFFKDGHLEVHFALKPMIPQIMPQALFYQNGTLVQPDTHHIHYVHWPKDQTNTLSLSLPKYTGILTKNGPWAWFRLIDEAKIAQQATLHSYLVTWQINHQKLAFELTSEKQLSPFVNQVLTHYDLPEHLFYSHQVLSSSNSSSSSAVKPS